MQTNPCEPCLLLAILPPLSISVRIYFCNYIYRVRKHFVYLLRKFLSEKYNVSWNDIKIQTVILSMIKFVSIFDLPFFRILYFRCDSMTLKGRRKVVRNCVSLRFDVTPITHDRYQQRTIRRLASPRPRAVKGTTAPIHPAGSGPGLPLSTHKSKFDYASCSSYHWYCWCQWKFRINFINLLFIN